MVLSQSEAAADWGRFRETHDSWASSIEVKHFDEAQLVVADRNLRFRLRANPTVTRDGKRHGLVREAQQLAWLARQGERNGFDVMSAMVSDQSRIVSRRRKSGSPSVVALAVTFDGLLRVREHDPVVRAVRNGLGHAKALGLGLLSVAMERAR
jgi:CRISPR system Cascade subunit CasE